MMQTRTERRTAKNGARRRGLRIFSWKEKLVALVLVATVPLATMPSMAFALPHGGRVTKGQATLSYGTNRLLINQSTAQASFSWTGFHVGSAQTVRYRTPGSRSVSMNFIGGTSPATIDGKVTSNGILTFMDANGLVFGSGSTVSASGIRAYGAAAPGGTPTGPVTNEGVLSAGPAGQVVLVGTDVTNTGTIDAPSGQVILAAGSTVTVSQTPSSSLSVAATGGGTVLDSGVIKSENLDGTPGAITLEAGMGSGTTTLAKTAVLDASAPNGGNGGHVTVDGGFLVLDNATPIDVSAPYGQKGSVVLDPPSGNPIDIGTASCLAYIDRNQSAYLSDTIDLTANINLGGSSWTPLGNGSSSSNDFTGTFDGNGHTVSGYTITATNSNGTGFIGVLGSGGKVENLGVAGTVNGGSYNYVGGVVGGNISGQVVASYNTGSVSGDYYVGGVVGYNHGGTVESSYNTGSVRGNCTIGGVVGSNYIRGTVETSYNTGSVSGTTGNFSDIGGVAGLNYGTVETSYNTGSINGAGGSDIGGVVGYNGGAVKTSYNTGSVSNGNLIVGGVVGYNSGSNGGTVDYSYNTGSVRGNCTIGGVVGKNSGSVDYSYNTGSVSSLITNNTAGGVVGVSSNGGTYTSDYWNCSTTIHSSNSTGVGNSNTTVSGVSSLAYNAFNTKTNFSGWTSTNNSGFNSWNSTTGSFSSSATTDPWFMGSITAYNGSSPTTVTGPILVPDLPSDTITAGGTSVYNGSAVAHPYTQSLTMGGSALTSGISTASVGPTTGSYSLTPSVTLSAPTTQTSVGSFIAVSGTWTITKATLTVTANAASMTAGSPVPTLSGMVTGFAPGQTLSGDGSVSWGTIGTSGSPAGTYAINGTLTLSSPYSGDYTIVQAPGNATALSIKAATAPGSGTLFGSGSLFFDIGGTVEDIPPPAFAFSGMEAVTGIGQKSNPTETGGGDYGPDVLDVSDLSR